MEKESPPKKKAEGTSPGILRPSRISAVLTPKENNQLGKTSAKVRRNLDFSKKNI